MSRNVRVSEPPPEVQRKIIRARQAIAEQEPRIIKCPYCRHSSIVVFGDTKGHVQETDLIYIIACQRDIQIFCFW